MSASESASTPTEQTSTPQTSQPQKPPPAPLKPWPYIRAEDVDLVFEDSNRFITVPRVITAAALAGLFHLWRENPDFQNLILQILELLQTEVGLLLLGANLIILGYLIYRKLYSQKPVYLYDFACYEPLEKNFVPNERFIKTMRATGFFSEELCQFQEKLLPRTGLGQETAFPSGILDFNPPRLNMEYARQEFDEIAKQTLDTLFEKTGVSPKEIGILVVNCSLFNPTPSMCARIINIYKMRSDIQSYNLSGMGCSASVIAVHLARDLLQSYPNTYALVFSTENITQNWYIGKEKALSVQNTLFRCGGAGILLTNKKSLASKSKYQLVDTYRIHLGAQDDAYEAVFQLEDGEGKKGVRLSQKLMEIAERGLTLNLNYLGTVVLPLDEQLRYVFHEVMRKTGFSKQRYTPNFKKGIQHFCIHAGGRAIIDGLEKSLSLGEQDVAPSRATLYRYGNTSSSSIWYELRYIERSGRVKAGDTIWQIALGSGFKCNSGIWRALKTIKNRKQPQA